MFLVYFSIEENKCSVFSKHVNNQRPCKRNFKYRLSVQYNCSNVRNNPDGSGAGPASGGQGGKGVIYNNFNNKDLNRTKQPCEAMNFAQACEVITQSRLA